MMMYFVISKKTGERVGLLGDKLAKLYSDSSVIATDFLVIPAHFPYWGDPPDDCVEIFDSYV